MIVTSYILVRTINERYLHHVTSRAALCSVKEYMANELNDANEATIRITRMQGILMMVKHSHDGTALSKAAFGKFTCASFIMFTSATFIMLACITFAMLTCAQIQ